MAVLSEEQSRGSPADRYPLLLQHTENHENEHVIYIERSGNESSSGSSEDGFQHEDGPTSSPRVLNAHSPSSSLNNLNPRSPSLGRRNEGFGRRRWSPFNTLLWISIELLFTLGQIIAAVVVLSRSTNEKPESPLFAWIVGYAAGCAATLPLWYWRYLHRNQSVDEQGSSQIRQGTPQGNAPPEPNSYITISFARSSEEENGHNTSAGTRNGLTVGGPSLSRLNMLVDHFKMALECFFAVWFVVGNIWIFGGNSSSADAPNLYRLCIVFLTISCIGYAMPFILCGMICCCLPCVISFLGVREDMNQTRGASDDSINALPTHKYKLRGNGNIERRDSNSSVGEGGIVAAGTENERAISGEDAVCCICLARYTDNDMLRELPCAHFFHKDCVDKWLKINASCPLCKFEIGGANVNPSSEEADSNQQV